MIEEEETQRARIAIVITCSPFTLLSRLITKETNEKSVAGLNVFPHPALGPSRFGPVPSRDVTPHLLKWVRYCVTAPTLAFKPAGLPHSWLKSRIFPWFHCDKSAMLMSHTRKRGVQDKWQ